MRLPKLHESTMRKIDLLALIVVSANLGRKFMKFPLKQLLQSLLLC